MNAPTFHDFAESLRGVYGTENAAAILYSLVLFTRPRSVLEVGAGLSSLYILKALQKNIFEERLERTSERNQNGKTKWYEAPYKPKLITIDDLSDIRSMAPHFKRIAKELDLDGFFDFHEADFRGFSRRIPNSALPIDMIWFDCGGLEEYLDFTEEYWPLVNPQGGLLIYHSTLTNVQLRAFISVISAQQAAKGGFELLSLLEPHKKMQNSISIIRKTTGVRDPIYTWEP